MLKKMLFIKYQMSNRVGRFNGKYTSYLWPSVRPSIHLSVRPTIRPSYCLFTNLSILVIVGTSGSGLFDAGVGPTHPVSGGQFWPPEKNRKWPEVGIRIFYHFFKKHVQFHIICVLKPLETIFSLATAMINNIFLWKRFKSKFKTY